MPTNEDQILELLPDATPVMLSRFMEEQQVSSVTVRVWAQQGVLMVIDGNIYKKPLPPLSPEDIQSIKDHMNRCHWSTKPQYYNAGEHDLREALVAVQRAIDATILETP